jgi:16S rRNA (cytidine1402-2'-O)-methyltransferase
LEEIVPGALYIVSTPIGNLSDITYRAVHILSCVDLIAAEDTRTSKTLLNKYNINTRLSSFHSYNQKRQAPYLLDQLQSGISIALISDAGTPGISDPAYHLVQQCRERQIRVIPIPGASAFLSALVCSGLPTNKFVFEGFLPQKKGRQTRLRELANETRSIIIYESPYRICKTLQDCYTAFGDRQCTIAREITKKFEEFIHGLLSEAIVQYQSKKPKGEYVIIIAGKGL